MSEQNFYAFFELSPSFFIDQEALRKKFYANSKSHHPDVHGQSDKQEQADSMKLSTINNEAFKTLSRFDLNLAYMLQLKGVMEKEEKYQLAPDFLMEMMEFNECIMEAKMDSDRDTLKTLEAKIEDLESDIQVELESACKQFDANQDENLLPQIKDWYYRKKYLKRLWENVDDESPEL